MEDGLQARFWEVDFFRGLAVILMIVYHTIFDLNYFGTISLEKLCRYCYKITPITGDTAVAGLASNAIASTVIPVTILGCCNAKLFNETIIFSPQFYLV